MKRKGDKVMKIKERVQMNLKNMYYSKYSEFTIYQLCDKIEWLWKWRKISETELDIMVNMACDIMKRNNF